MLRYLLFAVLPFTTISCQDYGVLNFQQKLPSELKEVSGIELSADGETLWLLEDSGNEAFVYRYDPGTNQVTGKIFLQDAPNVDWEDLAIDTTGNVYVGDFGNNMNRRKDLSIYTIKESQIDSQAVKPMRTQFVFEDQIKFPPKKKHWNFDVEAFVYFKGSFYLFTRNRGTKFDGTVKLYEVPATEGTHTAQLLDTWKACGDKRDCQITAATIHHKTGTIALLSYDKVWLLSDYDGDDFFGGTIERINLEHSSQKESICFYNETTLFIAEERRGKWGGNLYKLSGF